MELGPNVTLLEQGERRIYLVGTAHISEKSVREVRDTIEAVRPDTVCVELDAMRYEALVDDSRWRKLDVFEVIKQKKVLFVLANLALAAYQRRLGEKLGVRPGAEQLEAVQAAKDVGAEVVLADRDIQATLKRTWANLSLVDKIKLLSAVTAGFSSGEEITEEELEKLKEKDHLDDMMREFAKAMPQVQVPLIDERDRYLISSVEEAPGQTVVAVVGAGHVPGMIRYQGQPVDREALSVIPPPGKLLQALKWVIPALMLAAFWFGYQKHSGTGLRELVLAWVLPNSIMAGLMAMIGGAKPLSSVTAVVASPITSLNPTIGAGMVVGLVEAWLRKPKVEDAERLGEDSTSVRGIYRNRFTRVLLVAALATIGSAVGAWIGATLVLTRL